MARARTAAFPLIRGSLEIFTLSLDAQTDLIAPLFVLGGLNRNIFAAYVEHFLARWNQGTWFLGPPLLARR
jgi:hypothetical protein